MSNLLSLSALGGKSFKTDKSADEKEQENKENDEQHDVKIS